MKLWEYWKASNELYIEESLFICYLYPILSNNRIDFDLEFDEDGVKLEFDSNSHTRKVINNLSQFEGKIVELD